jgi:hypothetical protein
MGNNYLLISIIFISLGVVFFTYWLWKIKRQVDIEIRFETEVRHLERKILGIDNYMDTLEVLDEINELFDRWRKEPRIQKDKLNIAHMRIINTRKRIQDKYFHDLIGRK